MTALNKGGAVSRTHISGTATLLTLALALAGGSGAAWAQAPAGRDGGYFTAAQAGLPGGRAIGWAKPDPATSSGRHLSTAAFGHTGFTGTSIWIDPTADVLVVFLSNRIHPSRDNAALLEFRGTLHDVIMGSLGNA